MLLLLVLPVFHGAMLAHRCLQLCAPSNLLIRRARSARPRWRTAIGFVALTAALLVAMHVAAEAVAGGGPGWLNVVVLLLAWDAIKFGCLAIALGLRTLGSVAAWGSAPRLPDACGRSR
jgi:hypothetical protein